MESRECPTCCNDLIFTIGRMNPPTSGHMLVVREMLLDALATRQHQIYIILSHSHDPEKNPLHCVEQKKEHVRRLVEKLKENMLNEESIDVMDIHVIILCMDEIYPEGYAGPRRPVPDSVNFILQKNICPTHGTIPNLKLFIGEDRAGSYGFLKTVKITALPRKEGAMSATKVRGFVADENKPDFDIAYDTHMQQPYINELYEDLSESMSRVNVKKNVSSLKMGRKNTQLTTEPKIIKISRKTKKEVEEVEETKGGFSRKNKSKRKKTTKKRRRTTKKSIRNKSTSRKRFRF